MDEQQQAPADGASQLSDLLQNVSQGIAMLSEVITQAGIDPALAERVQGVQAEMDGIIDQIAGGGGGKKGAPQGGAQPVAMEQGASGVPQNPAMR